MSYLSVVEKTKQILKFPPEGRSVELWRAMKVQEAVITFDSRGKVELTVYAKDFSHKTLSLFDFKDVLKILEDEKQTIVEMDEFLKELKEQGFVVVEREKLQELLDEFPVLDENLFWNQFKKDVEEFREKLVLLVGEMEKEEK